MIRQDAFPTVHEMISTLNKGLGTLDRPIESQQIASLGWNLLSEDLSLPAAVLYQEKLDAQPRLDATVHLGVWDETRPAWQDDNDSRVV